MDSPSALTRREREVATLVAEGMTNREIAERLVISERTAEGHVEQIRGKLGFKSRAQVASWATTHALAGGIAAVPTAPAPSLASADASRTRGLPLRLVVLLLAALFVAGVTVAALTRSSAPAPSAVASRILVTVAGLGTPGYSGDGGPASAAQLDQPTSLAFDRNGSLYFSDTGASGLSFSALTRVRRIDAAGNIATIAGGTKFFGLGQSDFAPDVRLSPFAQVAVDARGNLFVSTGSGGGDAHWIAAITDGRVRLLAGNPSQFAPSGPGIGPGRGGGYSGDGGPATGALLREPRGLVVDSIGNLYIADSGNHAVRRVGIDGVITTVAGSGSSGFSGDGGPAREARLNAPVGVTLSPDGAIYIADTNNHRVRKVDHGGVIITVAGTGAVGFAGDGGAATDAQLNMPMGIALDNAGRLYIADSGNNRVRVVDVDGKITTFAGDGSDAELRAPSAVAIDGGGVLYIADWGNHRIRKVIIK